MAWDLNNIGFLISILVPLFAIPLSVTANLLTSPIRDWLSTGNQVGLKKRLALLDKDLELVGLL